MKPVFGRLIHFLSTLLGYGIWVHCTSRDFIVFGIAWISEPLIRLILWIDPMIFHDK